MTMTERERSSPLCSPKPSANFRSCSLLTLLTFLRLIREPLCCRVRIIDIDNELKTSQFKFMPVELYANSRTKRNACTGRARTVQVCALLLWELSQVFLHPRAVECCLPLRSLQPKSEVDRSKIGATAGCVHARRSSHSSYVRLAKHQPDIVDADAVEGVAHLSPPSLRCCRMGHGMSAQSCSLDVEEIANRCKLPTFCIGAENHCRLALLRAHGSSQKYGRIRR